MAKKSMAKSFMQRGPGASQNYPSKRQNIKPRIGLIGEGLAIGKQGDTQSCAHKSSQVITVE